MIVPVSAMATAQSVTTPAIRSSPAAESGGSSPAPPIGAGQPGRQVGFGDSLDHRAVVGDPLGEQVHDVTGASVVVRAQVLARQRGVGCVHVRADRIARPGVDPAAVGRAASGAGRGADPGQNLVPGGLGSGHRPVLLVRAHQARNDSGGGTGASRVCVQPPSGGGSLLITPERAISLPPWDAARWAAASRRGERSTRPDRPNTVRSGEKCLSRLASTTLLRRYTSASGMLIATGQTLYQEPHKEEANGQEAPLGGGGDE